MPGINANVGSVTERRDRGVGLRFAVGVHFPLLIFIDQRASVSF
jgi:hypothetical protein